MRNIKLTVAYDGTAYNGWQRQPKQLGVGVENVLTQALSKLCGEQVELFGAGRTDSGVHAIGQVANFHTNCPIPAAALPLALLQYLPDDIRIVAAEEMPEDWHARYCACGKEYQYTVALGQPGVFNSRYAWFVPQQLDLTIMRRGAVALRGTHDFSAFRALGSSAKSTVRTIEKCDLQLCTANDSLQYFQQIPDLLVLTIRGNGFLYKQVRLITGALVNMGRGLLSWEMFSDALQNGGAIVAPPAPACGLCLKKVLY